MKSWIAGSIAAWCVTLLLADFVLAGRYKTTAQLLARKKRDDAITWVLIASAAAFLAFVRKPVERRVDEPSAQSTFVPAKLAARHAEMPAPLMVDQLITKLGRTRESVIPLLQAIQNHYRYLPEETLRRICELTDITPAEMAGSSSFYAQFRHTPVGEHVIRVCHGTACHVAGARQITEELRRYLAIPEDADTDPDRRFTIDEVACLGCCSLAPVLMLDGQPAGKLTPAAAREAVHVS